MIILRFKVWVCVLCVCYLLDLWNVFGIYFAIKNLTWNYFIGGVVTVMTILNGVRIEMEHIIIKQRSSLKTRSLQPSFAISSYKLNTFYFASNCTQTWRCSATPLYIYCFNSISTLCRSLLTAQGTASHLLWKNRKIKCRIVWCCALFVFDVCYCKVTGCSVSTFIK